MKHNHTQVASLYHPFCFAFLSSSCKSLVGALTGEDQLESSSLLATMWDQTGEVAAGSAAAELFYTYAITHPAGPEFTLGLNPFLLQTLLPFSSSKNPTEGKPTSNDLF